MSNRSRVVIRFLSSRMSEDPSGKGMARPVVRMAEAGVAIGLALIILSTAIVQGFQRDVRDLVVGFGSHLRVVAADQGRSQGTDRIPWEGLDTARLRGLPGVKHVQSFAQRPAILETGEEVDGVVVKGLGSDADLSFLSPRLVQGKLPDFSPEAEGMELLVSQAQASALGLDLGQRVRLYLANSTGDMRPRVFSIGGVYSTGLQEFDEEFVFCGMHHLQELSGWGIKSRLAVEETKNEAGERTWQVKAAATGGQDRLVFQWDGVDWEGAGPHALEGDGSARVVVGDGGQTIADTAWISWTAGAPPLARVHGGTNGEYIGGLELTVMDYEQLWSASDSVFFAVPYELDVRSVVDDHPELFQWLAMLDLNVELILGLMVLIAILNMTSALLLLMLERTSSIGMLKALGLGDGPLMGVFVRLSLRILLRGLLWGNVLGFGLALIQQETGWVSLDARSHYLSTVPIHFDPLRMATIELGMLVVCGLSMHLPARYISRLKPVKALRFD